MNNRPSQPQDAPPHKTIYLIRHGVAKHNILTPDGERPDIANDVTLTDPSLVRQGIVQAQVLGEHLKRIGISQAVDLVVCSPLSRCMQTAGYVFPDHFREKARDTVLDDSGMMDDSEEQQHHVILNRNCKVFCHEDVREAFGMHYPDKRSPVTYLKATFPNVNFHPKISECDDAWSPYTRETRNDVIRRVHNFFDWLSYQPHNCIAVVSHGVWIECALMEFCPEILDGGKKRVYNCDVYGGTLSIGERGPVMLGVQQISLYNA